MKKSNSARLRDIISSILQDGQPHTFSELKSAILLQDSTLFTSKNTLSAILYQMMKSDPHLIRTEKGIYQYQSNAEVEDTYGNSTHKELDDLPPISSEQAIERITSLVSELEQNLRHPDYHMSDKEFHEHKKVYFLIRRLQSIIDESLARI